MEQRKLTKEDIDKVRGVEGFPIGSDEDIIALSDAPYYTACPNPFIEDFIREYGTTYDEATDDYHREPFAADVSEGKNDPIYNAHTYHTKVPYKAIMRYILHYTKPGDIVFDGFCGSGMTGVAAQMCAAPDTEICKAVDSSEVKWGPRYAILNDLSPIATYIAQNYNKKVDTRAFSMMAHKLLDSCRKEYEWLYETQHVDSEGKPLLDIWGNAIIGKINYTVWSDVFICPNCSHEIVFGDVAYDVESGKVIPDFVCPRCGAKLKKDMCEHAHVIEYDSILKTTTNVNKQVPVLINYSIGTKRYEKKPDSQDFEVIEKAAALLGTLGISATEMMHKGGKNWGEIYRAGYHFGIEYAHQFYTPRNYLVLQALWQSTQKSEFRWMITAVLNYVNKKQSFTGGGGGMPGVLYIASLVQEKNVFDVLERKIASIEKAYNALRTGGKCAISTGSSTDLRFIPNNSMDYIFVDPPFGGNIMYSEASFLWEDFIKVYTNNHEEAVESSYQGKQLIDYQNIILRSFSEFFRILKPGRWITIEFHNSQNSVWNAIREALQRAGLVVADVRTLDKKQGSFKQVTSYGAVKQDLIISCYKPKDSFRREMIKQAGTEETAWAFVRQHLEKIPVIVVKRGKIEVIAERQAYLLFDRMVAYHIMQGIPVPVDATDFYRGLDEKFLKRDNMYFLPSQVNEYDTARIKTDVEPIQFEMFVTNEKSAIAWLYQQLSDDFGGPKSYAELQPMFMQEVKSVDKFEDMPELAVLLEENFLQDEKGRWYIPDVTKEGDIAKLREKSLWKEFEGYMNSKGKLKLFRSDAIRVGFARLWKEKNYAAIVAIAERLPEQTIQEDQNLLMYYDISLSRV